MDRLLEDVALLCWLMGHVTVQLAARMMMESLCCLSLPVQALDCHPMNAEVNKKFNFDIKISKLISKLQIQI